MHTQGVEAFTHGVRASADIHTTSKKRRKRRKKETPRLQGLNAALAGQGKTPTNNERLIPYREQPSA
ncbi:MAG: hypothetical protein AB8B81_17965, partial [Halioglobus sp.]